MTDTIEKEAFYHFLELLPIQNRSMDEILPPEEQENWPIFQAAFQAGRLAERREILEIRGRVMDILDKCFIGSAVLALLGVCSMIICLAIKVFKNF